MLLCDCCVCACVCVRAGFSLQLLGSGSCTGMVLRVLQQQPLQHAGFCCMRTQLQPGQVAAHVCLHMYMQLWVFI